MQLIEGKLKVTNGKKIAIVSTRWNHFIVDRLVEGAKDAFARHGGDDGDLTHVLLPGAYELPMVIDKLLATGKYDAICALGAVIRGSTPNFACGRHSSLLCSMEIQPAQSNDAGPGRERHAGCH